MKEVVKISIASMAFTFNQDAYDTMKAYLQKLEAGYSKNPDGKEILSDIESRIVELILEHQSAATVVDKDLVDSIISQLGMPENVEGESFDDKATERFPRRLYRNMEGAKLGGVFSGVATYFNVDPVWVRVGFFVPLLLCIISEALPFGSHISEFFASLWGVLFLLYLILWVCIPKAKTARQKLEMRGEKITASSIHNTFAEEAAAVNASPKSQKSASVWADIVYGLGRLLQFCIKAFLLIIAIGCGLGMLGLLIGIIAFLAGGSFMGVFSGAEVPIVGISPVGFVILAMVTSLLFLAIICYLLFCLIFDRRTDRKGVSVLGVIFLILFVWLTVITIRNTGNMHNIESYFENIEDRIDEWDDWEVWTITDMDDLDNIDELDIDDKIEEQIEDALRNAEEVTVKINKNNSDTQVITITAPDETITIHTNAGRKKVSVSISEGGSAKEMDASTDKTDSTEVGSVEKKTITIIK